MFARFDENPAMTLRVIKETKRYGRTDGRTDARTDARTDGRTDNVKTVYPLQTKFAGGIITPRNLILPVEWQHTEITSYLYFRDPLDCCNTSIVVLSLSKVTRVKEKHGEKSIRSGEEENLKT